MHDGRTVYPIVATSRLLTMTIEQRVLEPLFNRKCQVERDGTRLIAPEHHVPAPKLLFVPFLCLRASR
jgi:hypothetical protein